MELQQLKYFKTVAETGKLSDAAESLFISAPALSTSISRLEKELEAKLFDRTNNRLILNQQGQIFLRYVNQVFTTLDSAKTELRQNMLLQGQHTSVASISSIFWGNLITAFSLENPQFTLSWTTLTISKLAESGLPAQHRFLLAAEGDLPPAYASEMDSIVLFEDHLTIMVHPDHPLAREESVDIRMLANETLFLPMHDYSIFNRLKEIYNFSGLPLPVGNAYPTSVLQKMVASGNGISFASTHLSKNMTSRLCHIPVNDPCSPWINRLYWRKDRALTADETIFMEYVKQFHHKDDCTSKDSILFKQA